MPNHHHPYSNRLCFSFPNGPQTTHQIKQTQIPAHTICRIDTIRPTITSKFLGLSSSRSLPHIRRSNTSPFLAPSPTTTNKHVFSTLIPTVRPRRRLLRLLHTPHLHVRLFTLWIFNSISITITNHITLPSFVSMRSLSRPLRPLHQPHGHPSLLSPIFPLQSRPERF
jgi:hypothetical protein